MNSIIIIQKKKHRTRKPTVFDFPAKNSKRMGSIGNYRQDEEKTSNTTGKRERKGNTETGEGRMGAFLAGRSY